MPVDLLANDKPKGKGPKDLLAKERASIIAGERERLEKEQAGFFSRAGSAALEAAADAGHGAYLGILESVGGLAQKGINVAAKAFPSLKESVGEPLRKHIGEVRKSYEDTGVAGTVGRVAGNVLGTGGVAGKGLAAIGKLPQLASTVGGRLGLSAAAGAGQGALAGGIQYDYDDPDSVANLPMAAVGAVGGGVLNPITQARSILTSRPRNDEMVKQAYTNITKSLSQKIGGAKDMQAAEKVAIRTVQGMAKKMKNQEAKAWETLMEGTKNARVSPQSMELLKTKAKAFVTENAEELPTPLVKWINKHIVGKKDITFGKLKELRTNYRDYRDAIWKKQGRGDILRGTATKTSALYDDITSVLRQTADDAGQLDKFVTANTISKEVNRFKGALGNDLAKMAVQKTAAAKFLKTLIDPSPTVTASNLAKVGAGTARAARAKEMEAIAMKSMKKDGSFGLTEFFNATQKTGKMEGLLKGTPQMKAMNGLNSALNDLHRAGALNMGPSANFGPIWRLSSNLLDKFTRPRTTGFRKQLIQYGLISKNEKLKEYMRNKITEKFIRMGVTFQPNAEGGVTMDIQDTRRK